MRRLLLLFPLLSLCSTACESDGRELFTQLSVRFILPDDPLVQDLLHTEQPLAFGLSELYHGHPRPARHDFRDIGGGYLAGNPGVFLLPMATLLFQLLGEFLLFVPQMGGAFKILFVDRSLFLFGQALDLLLQLLQIRRSCKGF